MPENVGVERVSVAKNSFHEAYPFWGSTKTFIVTLRTLSAFKISIVFAAANFYFMSWQTGHKIFIVFRVLPKERFFIQRSYKFKWQR